VKAGQGEGSAKHLGGILGPTWYSHWPGITSAFVPEMAMPA